MIGWTTRRNSSCSIARSSRASRSSRALSAERMSSSNISTRALPRCFASYIAASASCSRPSGVLAGPAIAIPRLADSRRSSPSSCSGRSIASSRRRASSRRLGFGVHRVEPGAQHRELVAAEAGDDVARPHRLLEALRDLAEQLVAGVVAQSVVDVLEPVDVQEQDGDAGAVAFGPRERVAEEVDEQPPVGEAGEQIVVGAVGEQVLGRLPLDGDRRRLREHLHDLALARRRLARVVEERHDGAEHAAPVRVVDRRGPHAADAAPRRDVAERSRSGDRAGRRAPPHSRPGSRSRPARPRCR